MVLRKKREEKRRARELRAKKNGGGRGGAWESEPAKGGRQPAVPGAPILAN